KQSSLPELSEELQRILTFTFPSAPENPPSNPTITSDWPHLHHPRPRKPIRIDLMELSLKAEQELENMQSTDLDAEVQEIDSAPTRSASQVYADFLRFRETTCDSTSNSHPRESNREEDDPALPSIRPFGDCSEKEKCAASPDSGYGSGQNNSEAVFMRPAYTGQAGSPPSANNTPGPIERQRSRKDSSSEFEEANNLPTCIDALHTLGLVETALERVETFTAVSSPVSSQFHDLSDAF
ncbi:hypothetical protein DXG03_005587, partial [Asterophora parasitica]